MMFQTGIWLWLCIGQNVLRGAGLNLQKEHRKSDCYQLNRIHCSFRGAQHYCHRQGGQLMSTWNQDIRNHLKDYLEEGKKWWIEPDSHPLIKHERKGGPEVSANLFTRSGLFPSNRCTYMIRNWDLVSSKVDLCSKEHFFICQGDAFHDHPHDNHESNGKDAPVNPTIKIKKWEISKMRNEIASDHYLSSRCHGITDIYQPTTLCQEMSTNILVLFVMAQTPEQMLLAISPPAKQQPLPVKTKFGKPVAETSSEKPLSEALASASYQQVFREAMGNVSRSIQDVQLVQKVQRACEILQHLKHFASQFSKTIQINSLLYPSEQLLKVQSPSGNPFSRKAPIALCSFDSFNYDMESVGMSRVGAQQDSMQVTGLAFNPFKHFDERDIVGSIGNVLLTSNHKSLRIQDLLEEAEIILWRNGSIETYPTSFNMSTDCFVITINITSLKESLIVWVEPENSLSITLYLGFQYQPNVTHFHLNITLPKEQIWEKETRKTWVPVAPLTYTGFVTMDKTLSALGNSQKL